jgi:type IV pilus assembly protein PilC
MQETKIKNQESLFNRLLLIGSRDEKDFIIENLSIMLSAGLSIPAALESILDGLRNKTLIKIVKRIIGDMNEGSTLYNALRKTSLLPPHALSLIKIGEESGNLTQNLQVIAAEQQKENVLNSKIHSAMIYPILVFSITLVVGLGVAWFVLPNLAKVFTNLKLELPLITKILISFSNLLSHQGYWLVPVLILILFLIIYLVFFNHRTNRIGQYLLFALPITKRLIINLELSRLGYVLSSLLSAGIPIRETMKLLEESSSIYRYKEFYNYLGEGFEVGNSFKTSFMKYPKINQLIPPPIQQVIISGEQSGKLSQSLLLVSNRFEQKTEENIKNLPVILEPVFLIIIWVGVLCVALAVILPIYSLVGNLNNSSTSSIQKR